MAALFCSSSSNKLPNYIDLTGSDEDDDDVQVLVKAPVTDPHASPELPVEFSTAIQDTLSEAARESTRRLATGHTLATVPGHGSSKKIASISSKKPNASSLVAGSPCQAVNQRPPLPSSANAIVHPPSPARAVSKPISPALARTQTTIEGLFHRPRPYFEFQSSTNRHKNGSGGIGEIRERIALKKRHIAREGCEELGLIEQINQSSLTNEEKAILVKHFKHPGGSQPSAEGSETEPDTSKKTAIYLLRTQLFPYIVSMIDLFKDIKTLEERNEIGRETASKVFAKLNFRETPLRSDAPTSKTRDNEIKAFVKAAFDEVIAERERQAAVMDSGVELGGYMQVPSDGAHRELGEAGDIGILDGLPDINMSEPQRQSVDLNKSVTGLVQGRTRPKRTADGVVKASSISKIDGPLSPHQAGGSIVTASAVSLSKGPQSDLRVGPKAVVPSSNMRIYQHTLASELEKHQQAATSATSAGLDASLPLETPTRSYIIRLYVGRARLLKFISEQPSSRLAKPPSKRRSTDPRTRRQPPSTKPQTTRSKVGPSFPKGKSNPPIAAKDTPNPLVLPLTYLTSPAQTKTSPSKPGSSNTSQASKVLNDLSTSLQYLATLVRSPLLQSRISSHQEASLTSIASPRHSNASASPNVQTTGSLVKREISPLNPSHSTQSQPSSLEPLPSDKMSSRRPPRRLLRTNPGQLGTSPSHSATQLGMSKPPRSNNLPTTPLLDKGHLMAMVRTRKPFVSEHDRKLLQRGISEAWWTEGKVLHVDFSNDEMAKVLRVIENAFSITASPDMNANPSEAVEASLIPFAGFLERPAREKIMALASKMAEADILSASACLISEGSLRGRDIEDVRRFLKDAALKCLAMSPTMIQVVSLAPPVKRGDHVFSTSTDSLLRRRELGLGHARVNWHSTRAIESELKLRVFDEMREWRSWTGGSSDAASVAWDVTGEQFAVGFSAVTDAYNMQYNRRNNLMVGDMWTNTVKEFPYHRVPRPRTNLVNVVDDLYLYQTVSQVKFGAKGRWMYSASFDKTVKIWDFAAADVQNRLVATLHQGADVDLMALSTDEQLATGSMDKGATVKVWSVNEVDPSLSRIYTSFNSPRKPTVYPSCMQWGQHTSVQKYLLVGFSGSGENRNGDIVVWDAGSGSQIAVSPAAINAFDAVWHPSMPAFIVGCKRPGSDSTKKSITMQLTSGHSSDATIVTASCTDGKVYVWDLRFVPEEHGCVHVLEHGEPIIPLAEDEHRERTDTGVRFTQWGNTNDRLYTGSSDGVIKSWNVKRATEDALVADVANLQSIVMSGAFSPDYSRLLVGDGRGSIHVLRTGLDDDDPIERMKFEPGEKAEGSKTEGRDEADRLVANGELMLRFGRHYQGPNYLDADARRQARSVELDLVYQTIHQTAAASVTFPTKPSSPTTTQQIVKQESTSNAEASGQGSAIEEDEDFSVDNREDPMDLS